MLLAACRPRSQSEGRAVHRTAGWSWPCGGGCAPARPRLAPAAQTTTPPCICARLARARMCSDAAPMQLCSRLKPAAPCRTLPCPALLTRRPAARPLMRPCSRRYGSASACGRCRSARGVKAPTWSIGGGGFRPASDNKMQGGQRKDGSTVRNGRGKAPCTFGCLWCAPQLCTPDSFVHLCAHRQPVLRSAECCAACTAPYRTAGRLAGDLPGQPAAVHQGGQLPL